MEIVDNYPTINNNKDVIRKFWDKEQAAERWSHKVSEMLPQHEDLSNVCREA